MGTTIAINARLQKRGATVLYVGSKGVEDLPIIARIDRKEGYNPAWPKPDFGVKRRHVFGIAERVDHKGNVLLALKPAELNRLGDVDCPLDQGRADDRLGGRRQSAVLVCEPGPRARDRRLPRQALPRRLGLAVARGRADLARI